jgi:type II secretory pathway pseudopilin PulG
MKRLHRVLQRVPARRGLVRGLTIIELMAVLIVLGVIITLVVMPAVGNMVARHRVQGVQAELLGDLQLARSERAQRNGTSTAVAVSFGGNADLTCYTIYTVPGPQPCDCTRAPGTACAGVPGAQELKTMQFTRASGVTVAGSIGRIVIAPPQGLVTPVGYQIDVLSATRGQLRTVINGTGVPSVCSPDGSIPGARTPC